MSVNLNSIRDNLVKLIGGRIEVYLNDNNKLLLKIFVNDERQQSAAEETLIMNNNIFSGVDYEAVFTYIDSINFRYIIKTLLDKDIAFEELDRRGWEPILNIPESDLYLCCREGDMYKDMKLVYNKSNTCSTINIF